MSMRLHIFLVKTARLLKAGLCVLLLFFIYFWFTLYNDSCQTNYLKIYGTDLRQFLRVGKTTAVDDQAEISFSIPQGTLP